MINYFMIDGSYAEFDDICEFDTKTDVIIYSSADLHGNTVPLALFLAEADDIKIQYRDRIYEGRQGLRNLYMYLINSENERAIDELR